MRIRVTSGVPTDSRVPNVGDWDGDGGVGCDPYPLSVVLSLGSFLGQPLFVSIIFDIPARTHPVTSRFLGAAVPPVGRQSSANNNWACLARTTVFRLFSPVSSRTLFR